MHSGNHIITAVGLIMHAVATNHKKVDEFLCILLSFHGNKFRAIVLSVASKVLIRVRDPQYNQNQLVVKENNAHKPCPRF
jgi:hypothetical protein